MEKKRKKKVIEVLSKNGWENYHFHAKLFGVEKFFHDVAAVFAVRKTSFDFIIQEDERINGICKIENRDRHCLSDENFQLFVIDTWLTALYVHSCAFGML